MYILLLCLVRVKLTLLMMKNRHQQNVVSFSVSGIIRELSNNRLQDCQHTGRVS